MHLMQYVMLMLQSCCSEPCKGLQITRSVMGTVHRKLLWPFHTFNDAAHVDTVPYV